MIQSEALLGYGATFDVEGAPGSGVFVQLAEITLLTPPADTVDEVDATHMTSPDATKESISGLADPGSMVVEMNLIPGSPSDLFIRAWRASRRRRACRIVFPNDAEIEFRAFVTGYEPAVPNDDKMTATLTCKVTGAPLTEDEGGGAFTLTLGGQPLTLGGQQLTLGAANG